MKLSFDNRKECSILLDIISGYEKLKDDEGRKDSDEEEKFISKLKSSIDSFMINNMIDRIGPMKCSHCGKRWIAICSDKSEKLQCPECKKFNSIKLKKQYR